MREIPNRDLSTKAIVLKRTNYDEADRILNLLTPEGKMSALARSVRKEKSRLAGGSADSPEEDRSSPLILPFCRPTSAGQRRMGREGGSAGTGRQHHPAESPSAL